MQALLHSIGAPTAGLAKTEVVVRRDVECARDGASELLRDVVILRGAVKDGNCAAGDASDWLREAIIDAQLEASDVEGIKVGVEGRISLRSGVNDCGMVAMLWAGAHVGRLQVLVCRGAEKLAVKVAQVTHDDEQDIALEMDQSPWHRQRGNCSPRRSTEECSRGAQHQSDLNHHLGRALKCTDSPGWRSVRIRRER